MNLEDKSMGATSTRVKTRGRRRGTRQRVAAGSLPCFCPALRLTPGSRRCLTYVAVVAGFGRRGVVKQKVKRKVKHSFGESFTIRFTLQHG